MLLGPRWSVELQGDEGLLSAWDVSVPHARSDMEALATLDRIRSAPELEVTAPFEDEQVLPRGLVGVRRDQRGREALQ